MIAPKLQYGGGVAVLFTGHRGNKFPSTALMDPMTKAFAAGIHHFIQARLLPCPAPHEDAVHRSEGD
jgi:hypothetical protein